MTANTISAPPRARTRAREQALHAQLVETQQQLREARSELRERKRALTREGVDPEWREIANDLSEALRPYTMFREQVVRDDNRVVVETSVPARTLTKAREALDRLGRQVRIESYREVEMVVRDDVEARISDAPS